jgi:hypothetical protein
VVFQGGWVTGFLTRSSATGPLTLQARYETPAGYRASHYADSRVWAAVPGWGIDVWNVSGSNPTLERRGPVPMSGSLYGIDVSPTRNRAVIVSNGGALAVIDTSQLPAADCTYPTY